MPDLDEELFLRAVAFLELQRENYRRYGTLLGLQQEAAAGSDFARVLELADEVDGILGELARLAPVCERLAEEDRGHLAGPRAEAIERLIEALTEDTMAVEQQVRTLTKALTPGAAPAA